MQVFLIDDDPVVVATITSDLKAAGFTRTSVPILTMDDRRVTLISGVCLIWLTVTATR